MCPKCRNTGRKYSEIMPGVYQLSPCLCKESETYRELLLLEQKQTFKRIDEAYESVFGKECENENGAVLSAT